MALKLVAPLPETPRSRSRSLGSKFADAILLAEVYARSRGRCVYCQAPADSLDHVDPEGPHALQNLAAACKTCNSKKGRRTPDQWRAAEARKADKKRAEATRKLLTQALEVAPPGAGEPLPEYLRRLALMLERLQK
jgi:5-methylcytosine-specific restriction endonuclease McrA